MGGIEQNNIDWKFLGGVDLRGGEKFFAPTG